MLPIVCLRASLDIFDEVDWKQLREKSILLTFTLECLLITKLPKRWGRIINGVIMKEEGGGRNSLEEVLNLTQNRCTQLSLCFDDRFNLETVFVCLEKRNCVCDKREPNILRVAPVALYVSFLNVFNFVEELKQILISLDNTMTINKL